MHSRPASLRSRCWVGTASTVAALTCALPCRAEPCRVELVGNASAEWHDAVSALEAAALSGDDCASIQVTVKEAGAQLQFTTPDARRAERHLFRPEELGPAVEALRTTLPREEPLPPAAAARTKPTSSGGTSEQPPLPASDPTRVTTAFAVLTGTRFGAHGLLSPLLGGAGSLLFRGWELCLIATWELQYFDLQRNGSTDHTSSATALGITLGRREPLGDIALFYAARLSVASVAPNVVVRAAPVGGSSEEVDASVRQGRAGADVGVVWPRTAALHLRASLGADVALADRADRMAIAPGWALTAVAGIEVSGP